jgi:hypothetical protein
MSTKLKTIFLALALLLIAAPVTCADDSTDGTPLISFTELSYDFGSIKEEGGPVSHTFNFTNDGDAPLVIVSAKASCGCTRPKYPLHPVKPGKASSVKVTYLPDGRPGEFVKEVKVTTNDKKHKVIKLKISGTVIPAK